MNKLLRFAIDGALVVVLLGLLLLPISSIGLSSYRGSNSNVLGVEDSGQQSTPSSSEAGGQVQNTHQQTDTNQTQDSSVEGPYKHYVIRSLVRDGVQESTESTPAVPNSE